MSTLDHCTNFKGEIRGYSKPAHSYYHMRHYNMTQPTTEQRNDGFISSIMPEGCFMINNNITYFGE